MHQRYCVVGLKTEKPSTGTLANSEDLVKIACGSILFA